MVSPEVSAQGNRQNMNVNYKFYWVKQK